MKNVLAAVPATGKVTRRRTARCLTADCTWSADGADSHQLARRHAVREDHEVVTSRVQEQRWRKPFAKAVTA